MLSSNHFAVNIIRVYLMFIQDVIQSRSGALSQEGTKPVRVDSDDILVGARVRQNSEISFLERKYAYLIGEIFRNTPGGD